MTTSIVLQNGVPKAQNITQVAKSYISNPDDAISGWVASGSGVTVATTTTSANLPENSSKSTAIDIVRVSGSTDYVRYRFTLDVADYNKKIGILWSQVYAGSSGDYVVEMWSNTASNYGGTSTQLTLTASNIPANTGSFATSFDAPGSGAQYMELRIRVAAGITHLYLSGVVVTPGVINQAPAVNYIGTLTFTPSGGWSSQTSKQFDCWRVGNRMRIVGRMDYNGVTGTTLSLAMPSGYTIDSAKLNSSSKGQSLGTWINNTQSGATTLYSSATVGEIFYDGSDTANLYLAYQVGSGGYTKTGGSGVLANTTSTMNFDIEIPILEWSSSGVLNTIQQDNLTNWVAYTPTISGVGSCTSINFQWRRVGDSIEIRGSFVTGSGSTTISVSLPSNLTSAETDRIPVTALSGQWERANSGAASDYRCVIDSNVTTFGVSLVTSTFPTKLTGSSFGGSETQYISNVVIPIAGYTSSQNSLVGFTEVVPGQSSGLVSKNGLKGKTDGVAVAAGYVGEKIDGSISDTTISGITNIGNVALTAGVWMIYATSTFNWSTMSSFNYFKAAISSANNTLPAGQVAEIADSGSGSLADTQSLTCPPQYVNISSNTTYYLNVNAAATGTGIVTVNSKLFAVRIA